MDANMQHKGLVYTQLIIVDEIKRICEKYNLKYFLDAGSMLGAVRHKGYIPWDDDMDIGMPKEDYEKFLEIAPKELKKEFYCDNYKYNDEFSLVFTKIRLLNTAFVEEKSNVNAKHTEIFVDIFPYYYISDDEKKRKKEAFTMLLMSRLLECKGHYTPWVGENKKTRIKYLILQFVALFYSKKMIWNRINKIYNKYSNTKYRCINAGTDYDRWFFPADIFDEFVDVQFEDRKYPIPKRFDEFLTRGYGDYMQLPPVEQRGTNHYRSSLDFGPFTCDVMNLK